MMNRRLEQILIAFDQLVNACFGGWADKTLSSWAWRQRGRKKHRAILRRVIDALFFGKKKHCQTAYESERARLHLPPELRD